MSWQLYENLNINKVNRGYWLKKTLCGERSGHQPQTYLLRKLSVRVYLPYLPTHQPLYIWDNCSESIDQVLQMRKGWEWALRFTAFNSPGQVTQAAAVSNNGSFFSANLISLFFLTLPIWAFFSLSCLSSVSHNIHSGLIFRSTDIVTRVHP